MTPCSSSKSSLTHYEKSLHWIYSLSVTKAGSNMNKRLVGCSGWTSRAYETDVNSGVYPSSRMPLGLSPVVVLESLVIVFSPMVVAAGYVVFASIVLSLVFVGDYLSMVFA